MRVAVLLPFLQERLHLLDQVEAAYRDQDGVGDIGIDHLSGFSWGKALNVMAAGESMNADYLLFGCDDAVPRPGALRAAVAFHRQTGDLPGCRFYQGGKPMDESYDAAPHGQETPWCRLFLLPPAVWQAVGPLMDLSWYVDIDYCQRLNEAGHRIRMVDGFTFDHLDPPRTWATPLEVERQHQAYRDACAAAGRSPLV